MALNNLESLIYTFRRDDVVKQNKPLLNKLSSLLQWIEGDGQFASLDETQSKMLEIKENVRFKNRLISYLGYFAHLGLEHDGLVAHANTPSQLVIIPHPRILSITSC